MATSFSPLRPRGLDTFDQTDTGFSPIQTTLDPELNPNAITPGTGPRTIPESTVPGGLPPVSQDLFEDFAMRDPEASGTVMKPDAIQNKGVNWSEPTDPSRYEFRSNLGFYDTDYDPTGEKAYDMGLPGGVRAANVFGLQFSRDELEADSEGRKILDLMELRRRGVSSEGFVSGFLDFNKGNVPFIGWLMDAGTSVSEAVEISKAMRKMQDGEAVTNHEALAVRRYMLQQEVEQERSTGYQVASTIRSSIPYVVEMMAASTMIAASTKIGASVGAAIGTFAGPGVGNAIGGAIGAAGGFLFGGGLALSRLFKAGARKAAVKVTENRLAELLTKSATSTLTRADLKEGVRIAASAVGRTEAQVARFAKDAGAKKAYAAYGRKLMAESSDDALRAASKGVSDKEAAEYFMKNSRNLTREQLKELASMRTHEAAKWTADTFKTVMDTGLDKRLAESLLVNGDTYNLLNFGYQSTVESAALVKVGVKDPNSIKSYSEYVKKVAEGLKVLEEELVDAGKDSAGNPIRKTMMEKLTEDFMKTSMGTAKNGGKMASAADTVYASMQQSLGGSAAAHYGYAEEVASNIIRNARESMRMRYQQKGFVNGMKRFGNWLNEGITDGVLRWDSSVFGGVGTMARDGTILGGKVKVLQEALKVSFVEAPVRGLMQVGMQAPTWPVIMAATGNDPRDMVIRGQLGVQAEALRTGDKELMDDARAIALGQGLVEYISENTGRGFNMFMSGVAAPVLEKTAVGGATKELGSWMSKKISAIFGTDAAMNASNREFVKGAVSKFLDKARTESLRKGADPAKILGAVPVVEVQSFVNTGSVKGLSNLEKALETLGMKPGELLRTAVRQSGDEAKARAAMYLFTVHKMAKLGFTPQKMATFLERVGYDGVIGEMYEERYGGFFQGLFGLNERPSDAGFGDRMKEAMKGLFPDPHQLMVEALAFSFPAMSQVAYNNLYRHIGQGAIEKYNEAARGVNVLMQSTPSYSFSAQDPEYAAALADYHKGATEIFDRNLGTEEGNYNVIRSRAEDLYNGIKSGAIQVTEANKQFAEAESAEEVAALLAERASTIVGMSNSEDQVRANLSKYDAENLFGDAGVAAIWNLKRRDAAYTDKAKEDMFSETSEYGQFVKNVPVPSSTPMSVEQAINEISVQLPVISNDASVIAEQRAKFDRSGSADVGQFADDMVGDLAERFAVLERGAFDFEYGTAQDKLPWHRRALMRMVGILDFMTTGNLELAARNPVQWAMEDASMPKQILTQLITLRNTCMENARRRVIESYSGPTSGFTPEDYKRIKDGSDLKSLGGDIIGRIREASEAEFRSALRDYAQTYLAARNVIAVSRGDISDAALRVVARRNMVGSERTVAGTDGTVRKARETVNFRYRMPDGSIVDSFTSDEFRRAHADEIEAARLEIVQGLARTAVNGAIATNSHSTMGNFNTTEYAFSYERAMKYGTPEEVVAAIAEMPAFQAMNTVYDVSLGGHVSDQLVARSIEVSELLAVPSGENDVIPDAQLRNVLLAMGRRYASFSEEDNVRDAKRFVRRMRELVNVMTPIRWELNDRFLTEVNVETTRSTDDNGNPTGVILMVRDAKTGDALGSASGATMADAVTALGTTEMTVGGETVRGAGPVYQRIAFCSSTTRFTSNDAVSALMLATSSRERMLELFRSFGKSADGRGVSPFSTSDQEKLPPILRRKDVGLPTEDWMYTREEAARVLREEMEAADRGDEGMKKRVYGSEATTGEVRSYDDIGYESAAERILSEQFNITRSAQDVAASIAANGRSVYSLHPTALPVGDTLFVSADYFTNGDSEAILRQVLSGHIANAFRNGTVSCTREELSDICRNISESFDRVVSQIVSEFSENQPEKAARIKAAAESIGRSLDNGRISAYRIAAIVSGYAFFTNERGVSGTGNGFLNAPELAFIADRMRSDEKASRYIPLFLSTLDEASGGAGFFNADNDLSSGGIARLLDLFSPSGDEVTRARGSALFSQDREGAPKDRVTIPQYVWQRGIGEHGVAVLPLRTSVSPFTGLDKNNPVSWMQAVARNCRDFGRLYSENNVSGRQVTGSDVYRLLKQADLGGGETSGGHAKVGIGPKEARPRSLRSTQDDESSRAPLSSAVVPYDVSVAIAHNLSFLNGEWFDRGIGGPAARRFADSATASAVREFLWTRGLGEQNVQTVVDNIAIAAELDVRDGTGTEDNTSEWDDLAEAMAEGANAELVGHTRNADAFRNNADLMSLSHQFLYVFPSEGSNFTAVLSRTCSEIARLGSLEGASRNMKIAARFLNLLRSPRSGTATERIADWTGFLGNVDTVDAMLAGLVRELHESGRDELAYVMNAVRNIPSKGRDGRPSKRRATALAMMGSMAPLDVNKIVVDDDPLAGFGGISVGRIGDIGIAAVSSVRAAVCHTIRTDVIGTTSADMQRAASAYNNLLSGNAAYGNRDAAGLRVFRGRNLPKDSSGNPDVMSGLVKALAGTSTGSSDAIRGILGSLGKDDEGVIKSAKDISAMHRTIVEFANAMATRLSSVADAIDYLWGTGNELTYALRNPAIVTCVVRNAESILSTPNTAGSIRRMFRSYLGIFDMCAPRENDVCPLITYMVKTPMFYAMNRACVDTAARKGVKLGSGAFMNQLIAKSGAAPSDVRTAVTDGKFFPLVTRTQLKYSKDPLQSAWVNKFEGDENTFNSFMSILFGWYKETTPRSVQRIGKGRTAGVENSAQVTTCPTSMPPEVFKVEDYLLSEIPLGEGTVKDAYLKNGCRFSDGTKILAVTAGAEYGNEVVDGEFLPELVTRANKMKFIGGDDRNVLFQLYHGEKPTCYSVQLPKEVVDRIVADIIEGRKDYVRNPVADALRSRIAEAYSPTKDTVVETRRPDELHGFSGAADGSDSMWGNIGEEYGVSVDHFRPFNDERWRRDEAAKKYGGSKTQKLVYLTEAEHKEGLEHYMKAAESMGREPDTRSGVLGLMARNWFQVKNSDAVFAVGKIVGDNVDGGTGWAVQMAKDSGKPVHVYDYVKDSWFTWNPDGGADGKKWTMEDTPVLTPNFAGVGTREPGGRSSIAIREVFDRTITGRDVDARSHGLNDPAVRNDIYDALFSVVAHVAGCDSIETKRTQVLLSQGLSFAGHTDYTWSGDGKGGVTMQKVSIAKEDGNGNVTDEEVVPGVYVDISLSGVTAESNMGMYMNHGLLVEAQRVLSTNPDSVSFKNHLLDMAGVTLQKGQSHDFGLGMHETDLIPATGVIAEGMRLGRRRLEEELGLRKLILDLPTDDQKADAEYIAARDRAVAKAEEFLKVATVLYTDMETQKSGPFSSRCGFFTKDGRVRLTVRGKVLDIGISKDSNGKYTYRGENGIDREFTPTIKPKAKNDCVPVAHVLSAVCDILGKELKKEDVAGITAQFRGSDWTKESGEPAETTLAASGLFSGMGADKGDSVSVVRNPSGGYSVRWFTRKFTGQIMANSDASSKPNDEHPAATNWMRDIVSNDGRLAVISTDDTARGESGFAAKTIYAARVLPYMSLIADPGLTERVASGDSEFYAEYKAHPNSLAVKEQLARKLNSRYAKMMRPHVNSVHAVLVGSGIKAELDAKGHVVSYTYSAGVTDYDRDCFRDARIMDEKEEKAFRTGRSYGSGCANVDDPSFRYGWHLDEDAVRSHTDELNELCGTSAWKDTYIRNLTRFAEAYCNGVLEDTDADMRLVAKLATYIEAFSSEKRRRAREEMGSVLASMFTDYTGKHLSDNKAMDIMKVSFDDLFIRRNDGTGTGYDFDLAAFEFRGKSGRKLSKVRDSSGKQVSTIYLGGAFFIGDRRPSGNCESAMGLMRVQAPVVYGPDGKCGASALYILPPAMCAVQGSDTDGDSCSGIVVQKTTIAERERDRKFIERVFEGARKLVNDPKWKGAPALSAEKVAEATGFLKGLVDDGFDGYVEFDEETQTYVTTWRFQRAVSNAMVQAEIGGYRHMPNLEQGSWVSQYVRPARYVADGSKNTPDTRYDADVGYVGRSPVGPNAVSGDVEFPAFGPAADLYRKVTGKEPSGSYDSAFRDCIKALAKPHIDMLKSESAASLSGAAGNANGARGVMVLLQAQLEHILGFVNDDENLRNLAPSLFEARASGYRPAEDFIGHLDGISNALFDVVKDLFAPLAGWQKNMLETLVGILISDANAEYRAWSSHKDTAVEPHWDDEWFFTKMVGFARDFHMSPTSLPGLLMRANRFNNFEGHDFFDAKVGEDGARVPELTFLGVWEQLRDDEDNLLSDLGRITSEIDPVLKCPAFAVENYLRPRDPKTGLPILKKSPKTGDFIRKENFYARHYDRINGEYFGTKHLMKTGDAMFGELANRFSKMAASLRFDPADADVSGLNDAQKAARLVLIEKARKQGWSPAYKLLAGRLRSSGIAGSEQNADDMAKDMCNSIADFLEGKSRGKGVLRWSDTKTLCSVVLHVLSKKGFIADSAGYIEETADGLLNIYKTVRDLKEAESGLSPDKVLLKGSMKARSAKRQLESVVANGLVRTGDTSGVYGSVASELQAILHERVSDVVGGDDDPLLVVSTIRGDKNAFSDGTGKTYHDYVSGNGLVPFTQDGPEVLYYLRAQMFCGNVDRTKNNGYIEVKADVEKNFEILQHLVGAIALGRDACGGAQNFLDLMGAYGSVGNVVTDLIKKVKESGYAYFRYRRAKADGTGTEDIVNRPGDEVDSLLMMLGAKRDSEIGAEPGGIRVAAKLRAEDAELMRAGFRKLMDNREPIAEVTIGSGRNRGAKALITGRDLAVMLRVAICSQRSFDSTEESNVSPNASAVFSHDELDEMEAWGHAVAKDLTLRQLCLVPAGRDGAYGLMRGVMEDAETVDVSKLLSCAGIRDDVDVQEKWNLVAENVTTPLELITSVVDVACRRESSYRTAHDGAVQYDPSYLPSKTDSATGVSMFGEGFHLRHATVLGDAKAIGANGKAYDTLEEAINSHIDETLAALRAKNPGVMLTDRQINGMLLGSDTIHPVVVREYQKALSQSDLDDDPVEVETVGDMARRSPTDVHTKSDLANDLVEPELEGTVAGAVTGTIAPDGTVRTASISREHPVNIGNLARRVIRDTLAGKDGAEFSEWLRSAAFDGGDTIGRATHPAIAAVIMDAATSTVNVSPTSSVEASPVITGRTTVVTKRMKRLDVFEALRERKDGSERKFGDTPARNIQTALELVFGKWGAETGVRVTRVRRNGLPVDLLKVQRKIKDRNGVHVVTTFISYGDVISMDVMDDAVADSMFEAINGGRDVKMTREQFDSLSDDERLALAQASGLRILGFSQNAGEAGIGNGLSTDALMSLTGLIRLSDESDYRTLFHEYFHQMLDFYRKTGICTDSDMEELRSRYSDESGDFNEEAAADAFSDYVVEMVEGKILKPGAGFGDDKLFRKFHRTAQAFLAGAMQYDTNGVPVFMKMMITADFSDRESQIKEDLSKRQLEAIEDELLGKEVDIGFEEPYQTVVGGAADARYDVRTMLSRFGNGTASFSDLKASIHEFSRIIKTGSSRPVFDAAVDIYGVQTRESGKAKITFSEKSVSDYIMDPSVPAVDRFRTLMKEGLSRFERGEAAPEFRDEVLKFQDLSSYGANACAATDLAPVVAAARRILLQTAEVLGVDIWTDADGERGLNETGRLVVGDEQVATMLIRLVHESTRERTSENDYTLSEQAVKNGSPVAPAMYASADFVTGRTLAGVLPTRWGSFCHGRAERASELFRKAAEDSRARASAIEARASDGVLSAEDTAQVKRLRRWADQADARAMDVVKFADAVARGESLRAVIPGLRGDVGTPRGKNQGGANLYGWVFSYVTGGSRIERLGDGSFRYVPKDGVEPYLDYDGRFTQEALDAAARAFGIACVVRRYAEENGVEASAMGEPVQLPEEPVEPPAEGVLEPDITPQMILQCPGSWLSSDLNRRFFGGDLRDMMTDTSLRAGAEETNRICNAVEFYIGANVAPGERVSFIDTVRSNLGVDDRGQIAYDEKYGHLATRVAGVRGYMLGFINRSAKKVGSRDFETRDVNLIHWVGQAIGAAANGDPLYTGYDIPYASRAMLRENLAKLRGASVFEACQPGGAYSPEAVMKRLTEKPAGTGRVDNLDVLLSRLLTLDKDLLEQNEDGSFRNANGIYVEVVGAYMAVAESYTESSGRISDADFHKRIVDILTSKGLVDTNSDGRSVITIPVDMVKRVWEASDTYRMLVEECGRKRSRLDIDYLGALVAAEANRLNGIAGRSRFLRGEYGQALSGAAGTGLWFSAGTGHHSLLVDTFKNARDAFRGPASADEKMEAEFSSLVETLKRHNERTVQIKMTGADGSVTRKRVPMGTMYAFAKDENGEFRYLSKRQIQFLGRLLGRGYRADVDSIVADIEAGNLRAGSARNDTPFDIDSRMTLFDFDRLIYDALTVHLLAEAQGKSTPLSDPAGDGSIPGVGRQGLIDLYELSSRLQRKLMADSEANEKIRGRIVSMSERQMFRSFGRLGSYKTGTERLRSMAETIVHAERFRGCLVQMLTTVGSDLTPNYIVKPNENAGDLIPDQLWQAIARFVQMKTRHLGNIKEYDETKSGIDNMRDIADSVKLLVNEKTEGKARARYHMLPPDEIEASGVFDDIMCRDDGKMDDVSILTKTTNSKFSGSEAAGYMKQLFGSLQSPSVWNGWRQVDRIMAWSKAAAVNFSTFFAIATRFESPVAACGLIKTIGGYRKGWADGLRKLAKNSRHVKEWLQLEENGVYLADFLESITSDDPAIRDMRELCDFIGMPLTDSVMNPMTSKGGAIDADIENITGWLRAAGKEKLAREMNSMLKAALHNPSEYAFSNILNGVKMAVVASTMYELRRQCESAGRAFDPIRELRRHSAYINAEIGGIQAERYAFLTPGMQQLLRFSMFSFQWTLGAWTAGSGEVVTDVLFGGHHTTMASRRKAFIRWLRMLGIVKVGVPVMMQIGIKALASALLKFGVVDPDPDDPNDSDPLGIEEMPWLCFYNDSHIGSLSFDITPILKLCGRSETVQELHDRNGMYPMITSVAGGVIGGMLTRRVWGSVFGAVAGSVAGNLVPAYGRVARGANSTGRRRYYMHFGKQNDEFWRWLTDGWSQATSKLSTPVQKAMEAFFGTTNGSDFGQKFSDLSMTERFFTMSLDPNRSAIANFLTGFAPFSVASVAGHPDAGIFGAVGPVKMGLSATAAEKRLVRRINEFLERNDSAAASVWASPKNKKNLKLLCADILLEAKRNGVDPTELLSGAVGDVSGKLYQELFESLPRTEKDKVDGARAGRALRALYSINIRKQSMIQSLRKKYKRANVDWKDQSNVALRHAVKAFLAGTRADPWMDQGAADATFDAYFNASRGRAVRSAEAQADAKGGRAFDNFLATDEVPETLFGIPIVASEGQYTEDDLAFFREYPKAGGYYDLGGR